MPDQTPEVPSPAPAKPPVRRGKTAAQQREEAAAPAPEAAAEQAPIKKAAPKKTAPRKAAAKQQPSPQLAARQPDPPPVRIDSSAAAERTGGQPLASTISLPQPETTSHARSVAVGAVALVLLTLLRWLRRRPSRRS